MRSIHDFIRLVVTVLMIILLAGPAATAQSVSLPFTEAWNSGTFLQNGWDFSPSQGNWTIGQVDGNNAADFSWNPPQTDYGFILVSPLMDATPWSCADIWLDFEYKLADMNTTGNEKLIIEVYLNNVWDTLMEFSNEGSTGWISKHVALFNCQKETFKIGFRAAGNHSNDILHWYIDNIHVYTECKPPQDLGQVAGPQSVHLSWSPPNCNLSQIMYFIFDDGTNEDGIAASPNFLLWLGNEFPIPAYYSGILKSFNIWFENNPNHGSDQLTIDIFDMSHNLLGSSAPFTPPVDAWVTIQVNDIPFSGPFYAMVKWNFLTSHTNFLGLDNNGFYASDDLAWYSDGIDWNKLSALGPNPGVFMIRAKALVYTDRISLQGDSSTLLGYNVYRTSLTCIPPYSLLTPIPITENTYTDIVEMGMFQCYRYFVTAVFENSETNQVICEPASDTVQAMYWIGMDEWDAAKFNAFPNPANQFVTVTGKYAILSIEATNLLGNPFYYRCEINDPACRIDVSRWVPGMYFVKVTDDHHTAIVKLVIHR